jgi:hypothetical protein
MTFHLILVHLGYSVDVDVSDIQVWASGSPRHSWLRPADRPPAPHLQSSLLQVSSSSTFRSYDYAVLPQMLLVRAVSQLLSTRAVYSSAYD